MTSRLEQMQILVDTIEKLLPTFSSERKSEAVKHIQVIRDSIAATQLVESGQVEWCKTCEAAHLIKWDEDNSAYTEFHVGKRTFTKMADQIKDTHD